MANALQTIRNAYATGELARCKGVDGLQISLDHQADGGTALWARTPDGSMQPVDDGNTVEEFEVRQLIIPRQTGFTGLISEGDEITISTTGLSISSNVYQVTSVDSEKHDAIYTANVVRKVTRRSAP